MQIRKNIFIGGLSLLLLGACGFTPLYGNGADANSDISLYSQNNREEMTRIYIAPIEDRTGQILKNKLIDLLGTENTPLNYDYKLRITLDAPKKRQGIQADDTASRMIVTVSAKYRLYDKEGNTLLTDIARAKAGYNILDNIYSSVVAEEEAERRAVKIIAESIALRLGVYFK